MNDEIDLFGDSSAKAHETPTIEAQVQNIVFAANDNFYKVLAVKIDKQNFEYDEKEITVTGSFGDVQIGSSYEFQGVLKNHPKFGEQFQATNYKRLAASTNSGVVKYLASDKFEGIGEKTAEKIVAELGVDAIDIILSRPDVLGDIGLKPAQQTTIIEQLKASDGMERAIVALNDYGFGSSIAAAIYAKYGLETLHVLQDNPYQLVLDIEGVSFARIDRLAAQREMDPLDERRIKAGVVAAINAATFEKGDTYLLVDELLGEAQQLLQRTRNIAVDMALIKTAVLALTKENVIVAEGERIFVYTIYAAEVEIAQNMLALNQSAGLFKRETAAKALAEVEAANPFEYDPLQKDAMLAALTNKLFILTGGPGTGKTTIINGVVKAYEKLLLNDGTKADDLDKMINLAAPTGRAAKRLSESTGKQASTIHRLLGINGREAISNAEPTTLEGQLLIIDEMSMVDTELFATVVRSAPKNMQIILVGDKDQLPSVGPGRVFYDLLASGMLNFRELETIHRQGKGSTIIELASAVKEGTVPADLLERKPDRSFFPVHIAQVAPYIEKVVKSWIARGKSVRDMQILAPMYRTAAGVNRLNLLGQSLFNPLKPGAREIKWREGELEFGFRVGDKVMQKTNDPENNVFNGDIGYIKTIMLAKDKENAEKADYMEVEFDAGMVRYMRPDFINITLAYATTIHKAQGGEYALVIMPLVMQFGRMLQRNLLYTGLTRASESLVLLGEPTAFAKAIETEGGNRRTTLQQRLAEAIDGVMPKIPTQIKRDQLNHAAETVAETLKHATAQPAATKTAAPEMAVADADPDTLTISSIMEGRFDPNIGMGDLTPYDFLEKA
ncbi:ATP-dependent RecD-like DNA helicase [Weissella soli]|uniref:SF1B family DNA helicase RecD2 n=1 Tax=Weissella soli TaxID=155866 RepID=UPI0011BB60B6|nr:ATP-dependent RecD-like DNA helicase [Weissella soli]QEA34481.1 ATP-dependent RecD-like DNA helicase [Weissella soli]